MTLGVLIIRDDNASQKTHAVRPSLSPTRLNRYEVRRDCRYTYKLRARSLILSQSCLSEFDEFGQLFGFKHLSCHAEAFQSLGYTAIDADHVDDGPDFLFRDAIVNCAFAVDFPFVHFPQRADHRQVHH